MDPRLRPKSDLYVFGGYVLLVLALLVNPLAVHFWESRGIIPAIPSSHGNDFRYILPSLLLVLSATIGACMVWAPKRLGYYLNDSLAFNLFLFSILLAIMLSLNVVQPGQYKPLRLLYLVGLLFFLTNALYLAVVKQRPGREVHPFYRKLALVGFGIVLALILLEGVFLFHQSTHRFNGTLGSRAWFLNHWEYNAEGYRDAEYDSAQVQGRRKILVIGDSFVAGHGIKDPKDRFTDQLQARIPGNAFRVYNLGVGGSDTHDENIRLRQFPFKPDILVFSWYVNDIEEDGERGGLILQHAKSYHDLWGPARYLARRSYLWNYIYWRFPHPDELVDYFGYLQQCFAFLKVRVAHLQEVDRLIAYGDSLHVPMAAVVFPFLENAEGSQFATDPIEQRFRAHGIPTLSVRQMILGKPAIDYIVNQNDTHPNERLHKLVADSLYQMLDRSNAFAERPAYVPTPPDTLPEPKTKGKPKKTSPTGSDGSDPKPHGGNKPKGGDTPDGNNPKPSGGDTPDGGDPKPQGSNSKPSGSSKPDGSNTKPSGGDPLMQSKPTIIPSDPPKPPDEAN